MDKVMVVMKKIQTSNEQVVTFGKRLTLIESKMETAKERQEKSFEQLKEFVAKTKEMLEARVD